MSPLITGPLGPCSILWDPSEANLELNPTFGGVTFKDEVQMAEIKEDQQGETIVDVVLTGRIVELTIPMTQATLDQLNVVIAGSVKTGTTLKVSNIVGTSVFANAKEIIIKPIVNNIPTTDTAKWIHIFRAYPFSNLEWGFDVSTQRATNVLFKGFPDDASGQVGEMWRMGPAA